MRYEHEGTVHQGVEHHHHQHHYCIHSAPNFPILPDDMTRRADGIIRPPRLLIFPPAFILITDDEMFVIMSSYSYHHRIRSPIYDC